MFKYPLAQGRWEKSKKADLVPQFEKHFEKNDRQALPLHSKSQTRLTLCSWCLENSGNFSQVLLYGLRFG